MVRNIVADRPIEPPGRLVCWLVATVELVVALVMIVGVLADARADRSTSDVENPVAISSDTAPIVLIDSEKIEVLEDAVATLNDLEKSMLGTWEDDYKGHRILTLNADGTGTMVVELDGLAATLFAKTLTFREEWSVVDGKVTMRATGGDPAGKVGLVLSLHGDSSTQRIVEVDADTMILVEEPSETRFEWRRVRTSESSEN